MLFLGLHEFNDDRGGALNRQRPAEPSDASEPGVHNPRSTFSQVSSNECMPIELGRMLSARTVCCLQARHRKGVRITYDDFMEQLCE